MEEWRRRDHGGKGQEGETGMEGGGGGGGVRGGWTSGRGRRKGLRGE